MLFFIRQLTFLRVSYIASSFGCLNVGVYLSCSQGFPSIAPCLEYVCAGGGGSVAFEGFV